MEVYAELIGKRGDLIDPKEVKKEIAALNQAFGKRMKRSFLRTTKTFDHTVTFHQETSTPKLTVVVYTDDEIYGYLDEGTPIRYAVMTEDFSPKTRPGQLEGYPGSGRVAYFDFENPREGIEARNFSELVAEKHGPDYQAAIDDIIEAAARKNT